MPFQMTAGTKFIYCGIFNVNYMFNFFQVLGFLFSFNNLFYFSYLTSFNDMVK